MSEQVTKKFYDEREANRISSLNHQLGSRNTEHESNWRRTFRTSQSHLSASQRLEKRRKRFKESDEVSCVCIKPNETLYNSIDQPIYMEAIKQFNQIHSVTVKRHKNQPTRMKNVKLTTNCHSKYPKDTKDPGESMRNSWNFTK